MYERTQSITPEELARKITSEHKNPFNEVVLAACETGKGEGIQAQKLADILQVLVYASIEKVWVTSRFGVYVNSYNLIER